MIIRLISDRSAEIIDEIVQGYDGSMPVIDGDENVVGDAWVVECGPTLVVLDKVQPGALALWKQHGRNVLFTEMVDDGFDIAIIDRVDPDGDHMKSVVQVAREIEELLL